VSLAQLEVIDGLEIEPGRITDLPEGDGVLLGDPVRGLRIGQIRERGESLVAPLLRLGELRLELLQLRLQRTRGLALLLELRIVGPAGARRLLDLARDQVLLGADPVDPADELAAVLVQREDLVQLLRGAPPSERRASRFGIAADLLQVERGSAPALGRGRWPWLLGDVLAGVLGDERRDLERVLADDDVLRHDRAGEPAVSDRVDHVVHRLPAQVEVRSLRPLASVGSALGARRGERVAPRAALGEDLRAFVVRVVLRNLDALRPAPGNGRGRGDCDQ
jgi:hypothetical protein